MVSLQEVLDWCLTFEEAWLDRPWGDETVVKVGKKIFAFTGGHDSGAVTVTVKLDLDRREHWSALPHTFVPAYVGRYGWMGIRLVDHAAWELAQEGIAVSYQLIRRRKSPESPAL
jgi:predicted DNA-binding protein (MmcQ/YjbR family)